MRTKPLVNNKKVKHEFEILDIFEGGMVLQGAQVKSLMLGKGSAQDAYVSIRNNEAFLKHMHIPNPPNTNTFCIFDPYKDIKLLLNKKEISTLAKKSSEKGLTIVPTKIYKGKSGKIKCEIAVVRGKKKYDKRQTLKEKEFNKEKVQYA